VPVSGRALRFQPVGLVPRRFWRYDHCLGLWPRPAVILSRHGAVCATGSLLAPARECSPKSLTRRGECCPPVGATGSYFVPQIMGSARVCAISTWTVGSTCSDRGGPGEGGRRRRAASAIACFGSQARAICRRHRRGGMTSSSSGLEWGLRSGTSTTRLPGSVRDQLRNRSTLVQ